MRASVCAALPATAAAAPAPARLTAFHAARHTLRPAAAAAAAVLAAAVMGCITKEDARKLVESMQAAQPARPDVLPVMLSPDPVRYPPAMYARKAQGNVTLRIFIDSTGRVRPESTQVQESSHEPAFDSAAVAGVRDVRFSPARRNGSPVAVSVLFPVYFRLPNGAPLPGDTILHRDESIHRVPGSVRVDSTGR
jgi:periplasmic protein TonB